jgi:hypothetical protein
MPINTVSNPEFPQILAICSRLKSAVTKSELWESLAREVLKYSMQDLQRIGGRLRNENLKLPHSYGKKARPYLEEQLFGKYHQLVSGYRKGVYVLLSDPVTDPDTFKMYWDMVPGGSYSWEISGERFGKQQNPFDSLFYYLICGFAMFVLDEPGHPIGTPFPGGFVVERKGSVYFCPIRDKEEDIWYSICNFCPAKQMEGV